MVYLTSGLCFDDELSKPYLSVETIYRREKISKVQSLDGNGSKKTRLLTPQQGSSLPQFSNLSSLILRTTPTHKTNLVFS